MHLQAQLCFGMQGIGNVDQVLPYPLKVSYLQQEIVNFQDRVCSEMIAKAIEASITNNPLKKLRLHLKK